MVLRGLRNVFVQAVMVIWLNITLEYTAFCIVNIWSINRINWLTMILFHVYHVFTKLPNSRFQVLQSFKIMDYSLLLGIHYVDKDKVRNICLLAMKFSHLQHILFDFSLSNGLIKIIFVGLDKVFYSGKGVTLQSSNSIQNYRFNNNHNMDEKWTPILTAKSQESFSDGFDESYWRLCE